MFLLIYGCHVGAPQKGTSMVGVTIENILVGVTIEDYCNCIAIIVLQLLFSKQVKMLEV